MNLLTLLKHLELSQWKKRVIPEVKGPILTRYDLQYKRAPKGDFASRTSGSTGMPVEIQRTFLSNAWWNATNLLEAIWAKRDLSQVFAIIRPNILNEITLSDWGPSFALLGKTGPLYAHPVKGDINSWLQKIQPGYLMTFPSILETIDLKALKNLKGIKTTGESLVNRSRMIADMYSCEEVGTIAIQCPDQMENYHVMENIIVEILDEDDKPCQIGRVVLTDLTSRYLYRYDIGDYAEFGECKCGRGLQTIKKIFGRRRNMVVLPDGSRHWPRFGSIFFRDIAPIKRFQMVQLNRVTLELRVVIDNPLSDVQYDAICKLVHQWIGYPFEIRISYLDEFSPGKFEEFISLVITEKCSESSCL